MALKLIPFNPAWINHDQIDVHAMYLRPNRVENEYGERVQAHDDNGQPVWDVIGGLPVRQHVKWESKGYKYITLANRESLQMAARTGTLIGGSYHDYNQHVEGGPWSYRLYKEGQIDAQTADLAKLKADIAKYGWAAVEEIRQAQDPSFKVPDKLKPEALAVGESQRIEHAYRSTDVAHTDPALQPERRRRGRPRKPQPEPVA